MIVVVIRQIDPARSYVAKVEHPPGRQIRTEYPGCIPGPVVYERWSGRRACSSPSSPRRAELRSGIRETGANPSPKSGLQFGSEGMQTSCIGG